MTEGEKHKKIKREIAEKFDGQIEKPIKINDKHYVLDVLILNAGKKLPVEVGDLSPSKREDLIDKYGQVLRVTKEGRMYLKTRDGKSSFSPDQYYETKENTNPLQNLKNMVPNFAPDISFECLECGKKMEYMGIYRTPKHKIGTLNWFESKLFYESGKSSKHYIFECPDCLLQIYYNPKTEKRFVDSTKRQAQELMLKGAQKKFGSSQTTISHSNT